MTICDQLEEQVAAPRDDRQVANLVDNEQLRPAEKAEAFAQRALPLGFGERGDEVGEGGEVDAMPCFDRFDPERERKVALAGAGLAEEVHDLVVVNEVQLRQGEDPVAVERGLEGEVEAG